METREMRWERWLAEVRARKLAEGHTCSKCPEPATYTHYAKYAKYCEKCWAERA